MIKHLVLKNSLAELPLLLAQLLVKWSLIHALRWIGRLLAKKLFWFAAKQTQMIWAAWLLRKEF